MSPDPFYLDRRTFLKYAAVAAAYAGKIGVWGWPAAYAAELAGTDSLPLTSIVYAEFKDDFAEARSRAESRTAAARQAANPERLADALLGLGIVRLLQGEAAAAAGHFREVETLLPADPLRQLRAATFTEMAAYQQYNHFPSDSGGSVSEMEAGQTQAFMALLAETGKRKSALRTQVSAAPALQENAFVGEELDGIKSLQSALDSAATLPTNAQQRAQLLNQVLAMLTPDSQTTYPPAWQAVVLRNRADLYRRGGDLKTALEYWQKAKQLYLRIGDKAGASACWLAEGDAYAAPLSSPLVFNSALNPPPNADSSLSSQAMERELDRSAVDIRRAADAYAQAAALFAAAGDCPRGEAAVNLRHAYLAALANDTAAALAKASSAREQFQAAGDGYGYWTAAAHVALLKVADGQVPEPRDIAAGIGEWGKTAGSFSYALGLGFLHSRLGWHWLLRDADFERALACFRLAESLYAGLGSTPRRVQSLMDQGYLLRKLGERDAAIVYLQQAVELQSAAQNSAKLDANAPLRLLLSLHGLWQAYLDAMDADNMETIAGKLQTQLDWLQTHPTSDNTGAGLLVAQLAQEAIEYTAVNAPCYRALAARNAGDRTEAERQFAIALAAADRTAQHQRDFQLAIVHAQRKDYPAAAAAYRRYLPKQIAASPLSSSIEALAAQIGGEAIQASLQQQWRNSQQQAALFFCMIKAYADSADHLGQLESRFGKDWWQSEDKPWESLQTYGEVAEGLENLTQAAEYYAKALDAFERSRQLLRRDNFKTALSSASSSQYLYFLPARNALKLAAQQPAEADGHRQTAYRYAERGKARALLDLMANGANRPERYADESVRRWLQDTAKLATWGSLLAGERGAQTPDAGRIAYLEQKIAAAETQLRQTETQLAAANPSFYRSVNRQAPIADVGQIAGLLPAGTALLQYAFLGDDLLAWAIDGQGLIKAERQNIGAKELDRRVRDFHTACERRGDYRQTGDQLSEWLLKPFAAALATHNRLLIVPYGSTHGLPFHALPWQGRPLIAGHSVSYLPSASILQFLAKPDNSTKPKVLAVGNPAKMAYQAPFAEQAVAQPPLPAAETEAAHIARLFDYHLTLTGPAATVAAVRKALPDFNVLHFATHGVLAENAPLLSSILLADGGALTVQDLIGLRLNADLVVLSACRTGQGKTAGGDDVLGFSRGLLAAGARAAIVSLWPVDDLATSLLMAEFYRHLQAGEMTGSALQAAQVYLQNLSPDAIESGRREALSSRGVSVDSDAAPADYRHPYYWAPFVLVG